MRAKAGNALFLLLTASLACFGGQPDSGPQAEAPVVFNNQTLFTVRAWVGPFSPEVRAKAISERIASLAADRRFRPDTLGVSDGTDTTDLIATDRLLMAVTEADAKAANKPRKLLAREYAAILHAAIRQYQEERRARNVIIDVLLLLAATVAFAGFVFVLRKSRIALNRRLQSWKGTRIRDLLLQRVEILTAARIVEILAGIAQFATVCLGLLAFYFYVTYAFSFLPWTRSWSATLFNYVRDTCGMIFSAVTDYIPNLVIIAIVATIIRYCIKLSRFIFRELGKGNIAVPGFYAGWADPTYKIVRFLLLVFGAIVIFPYVPGSRSPGFQGISIFLGLLLSLGSAGAVSNVIAGVLLTYTRAFELGDRVRIAETTGDVLEKTLLATHIRTIKNEHITVPNSLVLGSHIVNYSACARGPGLLLHSTVTIGYDAPWRQVHELLVAAAVSTANVLADRKPFVLQTALNDFYVAYEINAFTDKPNEMANTYAELHQNIQDRFNEAGVEICSPHFAAVRDANRIAIPDQYVGETYSPPSFRLDLGNGGRRKAREASSAL